MLNPLRGQLRRAGWLACGVGLVCAYHERARLLRGAVFVWLHHIYYPLVYRRRVRALNDYAARLKANRDAAGVGICDDDTGDDALAQQTPSASSSSSSSPQLVRGVSECVDARVPLAAGAARHRSRAPRAYREPPRQG